MNHDGYKSRKFWFAVGAGILVEGLAGSALFQGVLTGEQWVSLNQWLVPLLAGILSGSLTLEKVLANGTDKNKG
jgi:hypothetical protein